MWRGAWAPSDVTPGVGWSPPPALLPGGRVVQEERAQTGVICLGPARLPPPRVQQQPQAFLGGQTGLGPNPSGPFEDVQNTCLAGTRLISDSSAGPA